MKIILTLFLWVLFLVPAQAEVGHVECLNEVCFDKKVIIEGEELVLKNIALLELLKIDLYTAAIYLPKNFKESNRVLGNVPKGLVLHYHRGFKPKTMNRYAQKKLKKNLNEDYFELEERIQNISNAYQVISPDDRYALFYQPQKGTRLYFNESPVVKIDGEDFQAAYFGLWLSSNPISNKLRKQLLDFNSMKGGV